MNTKNLPPELKSYKEEFDFLHKMIASLRRVESSLGE